MRIATVLQALDSDLLAKHHCFFGGGTAIALKHNEFRESIDIDFVVSDAAGYKALRNLLSGDRRMHSITRQGMEIESVTDIRMDQYGIRTMLKVLDTEIKFEIIHESRIVLDPPSDMDLICGVVTLSTLDQAATKLLANCDRWAADSVFHRDLIDLAMMELPRAQLKLSLAKAAGAYGDSVERDLAKAIDALKSRRGRLEEAMYALKIDTIPPALLWKRIRALKAK